MNESDLTGAMAAVLGHLDAREGIARSLEEIHNFWNEWPMVNASPELTEAALKQLEIEGEVERVLIQGQTHWLRAEG